MARLKQSAPNRRYDAHEIMQSPSEKPEKRAIYTNGHTVTGGQQQEQQQQIPLTRSSQSGIFALVVCVGGIYASFLSWALLQERITTTAYQSASFTLAGSKTKEYFRYPIFLNTIQALFAFVSGSLYLLSTNGLSQYRLLPNRAAIAPLLLVTLTTTLASPFGYASLAHVDYLTFVLAKSCKLLPVMALHVTIFRRKYPLSKYFIVLAVTAGVAIFTIFHPPKPGKTKESRQNSVYGLCLLGINLLFDGLTNTVQDHIFKSPQRYGKIKGPQMMVIQNLFGAILMISYLVLTPFIPTTYLPSMAKGATDELSSAVAFCQRHPAVWRDVLGFAAGGAVGQRFIYATLERFESLLLVTVTVTRKMLTMVLSVVWFGKRLTLHQWGGVGLVFGGIATEAYIERAKKQQESAAKKTK